MEEGDACVAPTQHPCLSSPSLFSYLGDQSRQKWGASKRGMRPIPFQRLNTADKELAAFTPEFAYTPRRMRSAEGCLKQAPLARSVGEGTASLSERGRGLTRSVPVTAPTDQTAKNPLWSFLSRNQTKQSIKALGSKKGKNTKRQSSRLQTGSQGATTTALRFCCHVAPRGRRRTGQR